MTYNGVSVPSLSTQYNHFNKLSVSLGKKILLAAPQQPKETQDIIDGISRWTVSERPPADLANAGGFVDTIRKGYISFLALNTQQGGREGEGRRRRKREGKGGKRREGEDLVSVS